MDAKIDAENARTFVDAAENRISRELELHMAKLDQVHQVVTQAKDHTHEAALTAMQHQHEQGLADQQAQQAAEMAAQEPAAE